MSAWKIKSLVLAASLFALAGPVLAQQMEQADSVAADAVRAQKLALEETVYYCQAYVAPTVKAQLPVFLETWYRVNRRYLGISDKIRGEMLKAMSAAAGEAAAKDYAVSMEEEDKESRAEARATLDETPEEEREAKCYGFIAAFNGGQFDIANALSDEANHLDARAPIMGW